MYIGYCYFHLFIRKSSGKEQFMPAEVSNRPTILKEDPGLVHPLSSLSLIFWGFVFVNVVRRGVQRRLVWMIETRSTVAGNCKNGQGFPKGGACVLHRKKTKND